MGFVKRQIRPTATIENAPSGIVPPSSSYFGLVLVAVD
jgi:hypothetical protein